jgi:hypothetical protein
VPFLWDCANPGTPLGALSVQINAQTILLPRSRRRKVFAMISSLEHMNRTKCLTVAAQKKDGIDDCARRIGDCMRDDAEV